MILDIQSISPEGIAFSDDMGSREQSFTEINRVWHADGVTDRNRIFLLDELYFFYNISIDSVEGIDYRIGVDTPSIQMMFAMSANINFDLAADVPVFDLQASQHNIIGYPQLHFNNFSGPVNQEYIEIFLPLRFLHRYFPQQRAFIPFIRKMEQQQVARLSDTNMPITPQMQVVLKEILHNHRSGMYRKMLIEAKIIELLMLQLEQYERLIEFPICTTMRRREVDRMHEVKDIIVQHLSNPCSLIDLAHQVGTNEYNLKKYFKQVFGTTVFGYLTQLKMEEARRLLLSGEMNVSQVAYKLGYNDATNFTAAFKKYFGVLPGKLKK